MNIKFNVKTKIRFNGEEYAGVEAMPPEVRQAYERAMSNAHVYKSTKFTFNGQTYGSVDEMPAEVRSRYEQVKAFVDANDDGIPDVLQTDRVRSLGGSTLEQAAPITSIAKAANKINGRGLIWIVVGILVLATVVFLLIFIRMGLH
jgi:DNA polymerase II small subunit/DNA polymerase delta subunit B